MFLRYYKCQTDLFDLVHPHIKELPIVECSVKINYKSHDSSIKESSKSHDSSIKESSIYGRYTIPFTYKDYKHNPSLNLNPVFDKFIHSKATESSDIIYGQDGPISKVYIDYGNYQIDSLKIDNGTKNFHSYRRSSIDKIQRFDLPSKYKFLQKLPYKFVLACKSSKSKDFSIKEESNQKILSYHAFLKEPICLPLPECNFGQVYWVAFSDNFITLYLRPYIPYLHIYNKFWSRE